MSAVGGSIESVSIDGRTFPVAADADAKRKLGGYETEHMPDGSGAGRYSMKKVSWSISGLTLSVDDDRGDQEFLQEIVNRPTSDGVAIVMTLVSGAAYQGVGKPIGALEFSTMNSTVDAAFGGGGELTKQ